MERASPRTASLRGGGIVGLFDIFLLLTQYFRLCLDMEYAHDCAVIVQAVHLPTASITGPNSEEVHRVS